MPSASWANGWLTNDVVTASEFAKGIGAIYDTTLGSAAATIDVTGIVAVYAHLMIEVYGRGDTAATATNLTMRFNNDSAANYDYQLTVVAGAVTSPAEVFGATSLYCGAIPANTAGANLLSQNRIEIAHYAGATNNKTALVQFGYKIGTTAAASNVNVGAVGGFWRSSAAINRITLLPAAGNFVAGTRVTIYAMGA